MRIVENCKSIFLTILILSSLILTGSLWFDNYQGLSFAISSVPEFLANKFAQEDGVNLYEEVILPYKVTVINPDENKWIAYASDKINLDAWNIVKSRLSSLNSEDEIITGKIKEWDDLINRKSIILEFGGAIEYNVLRLAIPNLPKDTNAFYNVEKISLTKSLEGNTIYIMQNDNGTRLLYKILLKGEDEEIKTFMQSCENIKADVKYVNIEDIGTTKFYNNKSVISSNAVLFPISNKQDKRDLVTKLSTKLHFKNYDEYSMSRFVTDIFNNTDFAKFVTTDNGNIYINDDKSSIKIEKNGMVEYINNSKASEDENSAKNNFNTAIDFINDMKIFNNIFLLSASEDDGVYTFKFSIAFDGIPVGFYEPIIDEDKYTIIEVKVLNNSVQYFKGKLMEFELTSQKAYVSEIAHNILDSMLKNVEANNKINISELTTMYEISNEGTNYPCWFTKYSLSKGESFNCLTSMVKK